MSVPVLQSFEKDLTKIVFTINQLCLNANTPVVVTTLDVADGGTGATTLAAHGVVIGNGTSPVNVTGAGTATQVLTSNGASADPTFQAIPTPGTLAVTGGGTGVTTLAAHGLVVGNGASAVNVTGAGTAGQALISNGASADPTFQTGAFVLLNTLTASSSASLADTTSFTASYTRYFIVLEGIIPATGAVNAQLRVNSGGVKSTSYLSSDGATTFVPLTLAASTLATTQPGLFAQAILYQPSGTSARKMVQIASVYVTGAAPTSARISGYWDGGNGAVTGIELSMSSGNITSGTVKIYGQN